MLQKKIIKRDGTVTTFDPMVFKRSLLRAGANRDLADEVAVEVGRTIKDGDSTSTIYKRAFEKLNTKQRKIAMQYSLRRALFDLGPTGFPFEKFVAELFKRRGYSVKTGVHLQGLCTTHEVDVSATGPERLAIEVKFHNDMSIRSDVKTVLYLKSRFDDLMGKTNGKSLFGKKGIVDRCILVTNTKFTKKAIEYAECAGVELLGWNYPLGAGLQQHIEEVDAHPITCLPSIRRSMLKDLYEENIVTCRDLSERKQVLKMLPQNEMVKKEIEMLCVQSSRK